MREPKKFTVYADLERHCGECSECRLEGEPRHFCEEGYRIIQAFPSTDIWMLPQADCCNCGKSWEEEDDGEGRHWDTSDTIVCPHCQMEHRVNGVDYVVKLYVQETGRYIEEEE